VASFVPGGHSHRATPATPTGIMSIAADRHGTYVGTSQGLAYSATVDGPLVDLDFPGQNVVGIAVSPTDSNILWTASTAGTLLSSDGGRTWTRFVGGLVAPESVSAVVFLGNLVYASDTTGVFEWVPQSSSWTRSSYQQDVVDFTTSADGRRLYAVSLSGEIQQLAGGRWWRSGTFGSTLGHESHHFAAVPHMVMSAGRLYGGVSDIVASADGGQTWAQLGAGLPGRSVNELVAFRGDLWAATGSGVYRYRLAKSAPATGEWWAKVAAATALASGLSLGALGVRRSSG
jgi:photosystem II stability/assembly factor-like uncharacterized protein